MLLSKERSRCVTGTESSWRTDRMHLLVRRTGSEIWKTQGSLWYNMWYSMSPGSTPRPWPPPSHRSPEQQTQVLGAPFALT